MSRDAVAAIRLPGPMRLALDLAAEAAAAGEVPVGAVVTRGETVLASAANAINDFMIVSPDPSPRYRTV